MHWTKTAVAAAAAMGMTVGFATAASATQFIGSFSVTSNQDGSQNGGLVVDADPNSGPINGAAGFSLNVGQSKTFDLFQISTPEDSLESDDLNGKSISVAFNFSAPTGFSGDVTGTTDGAATFVFIGFLENGVVNWNNPTDLTFGNGGDLRISLSDETFGGGFDGLSDKSATVQATFKLVHDSSGPVGGVPEPASWALMIGGFGMAGAALRRRRATVAAVA